MPWSKGKYVVGEVKAGDGLELYGAILIPEFIPHASVRMCFSKVNGAGFFHVNDDFTINVYGESVGLRVVSRPEDKAEIAKVLLIGEDYGRGAKNGSRDVRKGK